MAQPALTKPTRQLTPLQTRFVAHYVISGGKGAKAIRAAGYKGKHVSSRVRDMLHTVHVRTAILALAADSLDVELVTRALRTVAKLSIGARSEQVRLAAAQDILNRSGLSQQKGSVGSVPGTVIINMGYKPRNQGGVLDGTHEVSDLEGGGGPKGVMSSTSTPLPHTTDIMKPSDVIDIEFTEEYVPEEHRDPRESGETD